MTHLWTAFVILVSLSYCMSDLQCPENGMTGSGLSVTVSTTETPLWIGDKGCNYYCPQGFGIRGQNNRFSLGGNYDIRGSVTTSNSVYGGYPDVNFDGDFNVGCCSNVTFVANVVAYSDSYFDVGSNCILDGGHSMQFQGTSSLTQLDDSSFKSTGFGRRATIGDRSTISIGNRGSMLLKANFYFTGSLALIHGNAETHAVVDNFVVESDVSAVDSTFVLGDNAQLTISNDQRFDVTDAAIKLNPDSLLVIRLAEFLKPAGHKVTITLGHGAQLSLIDFQSSCTLIKDINVPNNARYTLDNVRDSLSCDFGTTTGYETTTSPYWWRTTTEEERTTSEPWWYTTSEGSTPCYPWNWWCQTSIVTESTTEISTPTETTCYPWDCRCYPWRCESSTSTPETTWYPTETTTTSCGLYDWWCQTTLEPTTEGITTESPTNTPQSTTSPCGPWDWWCQTTTETETTATPTPTDWETTGTGSPWWKRGLEGRNTSTFFSNPVKVAA